MAISSVHVLHQGPVLGALGRTAFMAVRQQLGRAPASTKVAPGPELTRELRPLPQSLIDDYVKHLGGDPRSYRGEVPPHLFSQWCFPVLARLTEGLPYPVMRVVNGGCTVRVREPLRAGEPLVVRAQLERIDDDGSLAVLHQHLFTGTKSAPEALEITVRAIVPIKTAGGEERKNGGEAKKQKPHVPEDAREIQRISLPHDAGLSFAKLTGDFNPIHWLLPYAKASGFPDVILHGFGTFARAWEALVRGVYAGDVHALQQVECRLTRPLVLPHDVSVFVRGHELFVADAVSGPAYLTGSFHARGES